MMDSMKQIWNRQQVASALSRQYGWRDRTAVPRQRLPKTRKGCKSRMNPLPTVRQSWLVALVLLARQSYTAAPWSVKVQKGLHFWLGGVADSFGRTIPIGATEKDCRAILVGAADPFCRAMFSHSPERAAFRLRWREGTVLSRHPEWRDKHCSQETACYNCCCLLLLGHYALLYETADVKNHVSPLEW